MSNKELKELANKELRWLCRIAIVASHNIIDSKDKKNFYDSIFIANEVIRDAINN